MQTIALVQTPPRLRDGLPRALAADTSLRVSPGVFAIDEIELASQSAQVLVAGCPGVARATQVGTSVDPAKPLVALTDYAHAPLVDRLCAGSCAILPEHVESAVVLVAIRSVLAGLSVLSADLATLAFRRVTSGAVDATGSDEPPFDGLSPRELQVLERMAQGLANRDIAQALAISEHTVKFHVGQILAKMGASSRTQAVAVALRRGLVGV